MHKPVAITGIGIVSSAGVGLDAFHDALLHGKINFSKIPYPILSFPVIAASILNFSFSSALQNFKHLKKDTIIKLEKIANPLPLQIQIALIAALEAWHNSNIESSLDPTRVGLVVAAQNTSGNYQYAHYASFLKNPEYLSPRFALNYLDTNYIGVLSEVFGILNEGFTVGGASACGNVALIKACQSIDNSDMDACVVVGAMADLSPMELQAFHNIGALGGHHYKEEPNKACRPFDKAHEGFIYGQASACIILEAVDQAVKRKAPILGYILGTSLLMEGNRLSNPNKEGELRVMQLALKSAGINIEDINYINAHGTSAPLGDDVEIAAIESLLGEHSSKVMINSTKSIIGHALWSAGVVEAVSTIIQINHEFVHPNLNLDNPISTKSQFVMNRSIPYQVQTALSNSFGFGGIYTSIVISKLKP